MVVYYILAYEISVLGVNEWFLRSIDLYWKDHIIEKIIQNHAVTPEEVEDVIFEGQPEVRKHTENRFLIYGQTLSGRYLFIVIEEESKGIYVPITARDMKEKEKKAFRKRQAKKFS